MPMDDFVFHRPQSLPEACALHQELGDGAFYIAGGTDLVTDLKRGAKTARHLISLSGLAELRGIRRDGDLVRIGALASHAEVAASPEVRGAFPGLAEAAGKLGAVQIRNQGTIGGNFCAAVPCADTPPICVAGGLRLLLSDGRRDRELTAQEFFLGPRQSALEPGEVLREILVAPQPANAGASYQRFTLRGGLALSVASVAAWLTLDDARIGTARVALGAVAPVPLLVEECASILSGQLPEDGVLSEAAEASAKAARPITDIRGSEEYRREIVSVMARRALVAAIERARGAKSYPWERV